LEKLRRGRAKKSGRSPGVEEEKYPRRNISERKTLLTKSRRERGGQERRGDQRARLERWPDARVFKNSIQVCWGERVLNKNPQRKGERGAGRGNR